MTAHACKALDPDCYRCDLNVDEMRTIVDDLENEADALEPAIKVLQEQQADMRADAEAMQVQIVAYDRARRRSFRPERGDA